MYNLLIGLFIIICLTLVVVILLQSSKGGGLSGAFGGSGAMGTVFGGRGAASFLSKVTTYLAIAFLSISLLLSFLNRGIERSGSLVEKERQKGSTPASGLQVPLGNTPEAPPLQRPEDIQPDTTK